MLTSVIIPTIRDKIQSRDRWSDIQKILGPSELIIARGLGVAEARNRGARKAKGELLIFIDDDVIVPDYLLERVKHLNKREFTMTFGKHFPSTRLLAISREDFESIGGFDSRIKLLGEDRDFYLRAVDSGLRCFAIPINDVYHVPHVIRARRKG